MALAFLLSLSLSGGLVYAQPSRENAQEVKEKAGDYLEENVSYEDFKAQVLTRIDNASERIEMVQGNIEESQLDEETQQILVDAFQQVQDSLAEYRAQVEATTSYDELRAANEELKAMLQESADDIKAAFKEAALAIAQNAMESFEEFNNQVDEDLTALLAECPEEEEAITDLQAQNDQLEDGIQELAEELQAQNVNAAKQEVAQLTVLAQDMAENMASVYQTCDVADEEVEEGETDEESGENEETEV